MSRIAHSERTSHYNPLALSCIHIQQILNRASIEIFKKNHQTKRKEMLKLKFGPQFI